MKWEHIKNFMPHVPVLSQEVMTALSVGKGMVALDATVNGGGHAELLLRKVGARGKVIGMDRDASVLDRAKKRFAEHDNFIPICGNFRDAETLLPQHGVKQIDRALLDLGMSSWQLEHSGRGFSFLRDEPLLMTFECDPKPEHTVQALLRRSTEKELTNIFQVFGEERHARRIAQSIVRERRTHPLRSSRELAALVERATPGAKRGKIHPATRVFQALRIAANDELGALADGLPVLWTLLSPGGRIAVISFHSLEDRLVKQFFRKRASTEEGIPITKKPIVPGLWELRENPRARSAKLRVMAKL